MNEKSSKEIKQHRSFGGGYHMCIPLDQPFITIAGCRYSKTYRLKCGPLEYQILKNPGHPYSRVKGLGFPNILNPKL